MITSDAGLNKTKEETKWKDAALSSLRVFFSWVETSVLAMLPFAPSGRVPVSWKAQ